MSGTIELAGKVALVTGGARGIGAATVERLRAAGASVAVVDRDFPTDPTGTERTLLLVGDVTDPAAMANCVAATIDRFGRLDIVIANAGITPPPATIRSIDRAVFDSVMAVNFGGVLNIVRAAADEIVASGGHILLVSSCAAFTPGMGGSAYMVSKAAVEQLGRALRIELAAVGASAGLAYFGVVDTDLARHTLDDDPIGRRIGGFLPWPLSRRLPSQRAAELLVHAVRTRRARLIAPAVWTPYFWFRGMLNPILERRLVRDRRVAQIIRDLEETHSR
ncbi:short-chain dehydrogenase [Rhodococcus sp. 15-725-2-2b]|jgi:NAD(P)-dependent dehydrogenase (short-subunit alcohol dehydrogenase family)|uniref:SDR family NAD(P)-dependent oxidoreductase n=1 Tax=unclassified Rhodococcus (in: high G+C Gram-positive bacteria) TaxID=192944 RepID=UPI000B9B5080|nr:MULTISPECIES: SDR family NAD(P)-dependent oxidoreductase [unclassified Rhodococcus (in: high G+C Gram-positive bacteria)]OZC61754.1 short-chain dehydrogenase [Rhodococcus sp. 06-469-3-2]OZD42933.1 short-chain dehydrogenase [Rhodococcus sp. 06-1477-1A]OZE74009.1 short-chain dehydrogenase [Rhodococcus sp. 15-725-2-2b]